MNYIFNLTMFFIFSINVYGDCAINRNKYGVGEKYISDISKKIYECKENGNFKEVKVDTGFEVVLGSSFCIYNGIPYQKYSRVEESNLLLTCISIGLDYNNEEILSFEIEGSKDYFYDEFELNEMGLKYEKFYGI